MNETENLKLKGCPACGHVPEVELIGNKSTAKRSIRIRCPKCRLQRTDSGLITPVTALTKRAIELWNHRPAEQALREAVLDDVAVKVSGLKLSPATEMIISLQEYISSLKTTNEKGKE